MHVSLPACTLFILARSLAVPQSYMQHTISDRAVIYLIWALLSRPFFSALLSGVKFLFGTVCSSFNAFPNILPSTLFGLLHFAVFKETLFPGSGDEKLNRGSCELSWSSH